MARVKLIDTYDLERSLGEGAVLDRGRADWAIEMVSSAALDLTGQSWSEPLDVPPGAVAILALATRRLYTNPDRFNREAEGDYSYGLDASVTKAAIFTPDEEARLRAFKRVQRPQGIGTMSVRRGDVYTSGTVYVPDGTAYGFPWYSVGDV